jgi:hypothetical protein
METSFLSGSENLYKYLVSVGLLLMVMTVFYPLKEKQEIEISTIKLEKEVLKLNFKIKDNYKKVKELKKVMLKIDTLKLNATYVNKLDEINIGNHLNQIEIEKKNDEIKKRNTHITLYNYLFWGFFPLGFLLALYGFLKWLKSKKTDDAISKLDKKIKELEIRKLEKDLED